MGEDFAVEMRTDFPKEYMYPLRVTSFDADRHRRIKPSAILRYQQEAGELHLREGKIPYEYLYEQGIIFVTTHISSVVHRHPVMDEHLTLTTWHRDSKGLQFYRCYRFTDASGATVIESIGAFVMIHPETHRLLRAHVFDQFGIPKQGGRTVSIPDPEKMAIPELLSFAGIRPVRYSDTDYNGHLNNTLYADFITDFLPDGMQERELQSFHIRFITEAKEGETLSIYSGRDGGKAPYYFRGIIADKPCFEAEANFSE